MDEQDFSEDFPKDENEAVEHLRKKLGPNAEIVGIKLAGEEAARFLAGDDEILKNKLREQGVPDFVIEKADFDKFRRDAKVGGTAEAQISAFPPGMKEDERGHLVVDESIPGAASVIDQTVAALTQMLSVNFPEEIDTSLTEDRVEQMLLRLGGSSSDGCETCLRVRHRVHENLLFNAPGPSSNREFKYEPQFFETPSLRALVRDALAKAVEIAKDTNGDGDGERESNLVDDVVAEIHKLDRNSFAWRVTQRGLDTDHAPRLEIGIDSLSELDRETGEMDPEDRVHMVVHAISEEVAHALALVHQVGIPRD